MIFAPLKIQVIITDNLKQILIPDRTYNFSQDYAQNH